MVINHNHGYLQFNHSSIVSRSIFILSTSYRSIRIVFLLVYSIGISSRRDKLRSRNDEWKVYLISNIPSTTSFGCHSNWNDYRFKVQFSFQSIWRIKWRVLDHLFDRRERTSRRKRWTIDWKHRNPLTHVYCLWSIKRMLILSLLTSNIVSNLAEFFSDVNSLTRRRAKKSRPISVDERLHVVREEKSIGQDWICLSRAVQWT